MSSRAPEGKQRAPRQRRARATVERILGAARLILVDEGSEALNTNRIAAHAGVGVGSVYEYFASKEAIATRLLEELALYEATRISAALDALADAPLDRLIPRMVETAFALYRETAPLHGPLAAIVAPDRARVGTRPGERAIIAAIRARLDAHPRRLAVRDHALAAEVVFHLVESMAHRFARRPRRQKAILAETAHAALRYLGI